MRLHAPDALSLGLGLTVLLAGTAGLLGWLDVRALAQGWLLPAVVVAGGVTVVVSAIRRA
ncbi:MAG TPA: hypothetical protein VGO86_04455 [Candidatus Dormibacteraeota bacterium]|jgi:hypothetical protein